MPMLIRALEIAAALVQRPEPVVVFASCMYAFISKDSLSWQVLDQPYL